MATLAKHRRGHSIGLICFAIEIDALPLGFSAEYVLQRHFLFEHRMVRAAFLYRNRRIRARPFLRWSTCSQFNYCSELEGTDALFYTETRWCVQGESQAQTMQIEASSAISGMCGVSKHVPRFVRFNDFDLTEHLQ